MTTSNMLRRFGESLKPDISFEIYISSLQWLCMGCCEEDFRALSLVSDLLLVSCLQKAKFITVLERGWLRLF